MENITQRSIIDSEIKVVTAKLLELVNNNFNQADIVLLEEELRRLVALRKDALISLKDPSFYIGKVFAEDDREDRSRLAGELEAEVINVLIEFRKQSEHEQSGSILEYDQMRDVLSFLRFFKHTGSSQQEESTPSSAEWTGIAWANRPGLAIHEFCSDLVKHKYISLANASLLEFVLEDRKAARDDGISIDWDGSKESLATFLMVSQFLGILNPKKAKAVNRAAINDSFGAEKYPTPPVAEIIHSSFTINGHKLQVSDISRDIQKRLVIELDSLMARVEYLANQYCLSSKTSENMTWDDILYCLFALCDEPSVDKHGLLGDFQSMDFQILKFLNAYVKNHGKDRKEIGTQLANLP